MFAIKAKKRDSSVKLDDLKKTGDIPAVFYGGKTKSTPVSVGAVEFKKVWIKAGESSTIKITTEDGSVDTLIHEVQTHPITGEPTHVDFLVVDMNKPIQVSIPVEFEGIAGAVKSGMGTLVKVLHEVEVEALPKDLPHSLSVDISKLATLEDQILVSDIVLPKGVTLVTKETEVVASIAEQKEEAEDETPVDLSSIEVEKKGKKEEEADSVENN